MFVRPSILAMSLLALALPLGAQDTTLHSAEHDYRIVTVATGLENPWSLAVLPSGDLLVTERPGRLRIIRKGVLLPEPVAGVPTVRAPGQGGLLDVVLHPQFATNRYVYLSYAKPNAEGTQGTTAVMRAKFVNDRLVEPQEIIETKVWSQGRGHHGSRLAFDANGFLFITVGDRQVPSSGNLEQHPSQLLASHHGKVLRLHDDGRVPADNPFVGREGALPEIWSYGHRNSQGMAVQPGTNVLWAVEHGPQGGDELNIIEAGKNYGWPVIGFGVNYGSGTTIHSGTTRAGMEQPVNVWVPSIATSGMLFYTGDKFPGWRNSLFVGGMVGERLARLTLDGKRVVSQELLAQRIGRVRDVRQGLDGFIYLVIDNATPTAKSVVRLEPVKR